MRFQVFGSNGLYIRLFEPKRTTENETAEGCMEAKTFDQLETGLELHSKDGEETRLSFIAGYSSDCMKVASAPFKSKDEKKEDKSSEPETTSETVKEDPPTETEPEPEPVKAEEVEEEPAPAAPPDDGHKANDLTVRQELQKASISINTVSEREQEIARMPKYEVPKENTVVVLQ